ncbi:hypothetical protein Vretimale_16755, partial [Volvox reticuliferus]
EPVLREALQMLQLHVYDLAGGKIMGFLPQRSERRDAALHPSGDGPDTMALAARGGGGGGSTASHGQAPADTGAAIGMEVDKTAAVVEVRPHGIVQHGEDLGPDLDLDGGAGDCSWPGLLAVQVFSWRGSEGDTDDGGGDEADGGIALRSTPSGDAAATAAAAGVAGTASTAVAASSAEHVAWPICGAAGSSAVAALPDLESLPPLKAAMAVLTAVERARCSGGHAEGGAQTATTEAETERRVAVLQKLCG